MSSHSFPKIDQKEYLKRYLSGDKKKKKKKDKHKKPAAESVKVKIIDDDINYLETNLEIDEELLLTGDDAPQIVGEYIEENPVRKELKWKSIVIKDEPEDRNQTDSDLWGRKAAEVNVKQEFDNSPSRRNHKNYSSSPQRRSRRSPLTTKSKRDRSPSSRRANIQSPDRVPKIKTEPESPQHREHIISNSNDISPPSSRNSDQSPPRNFKSSSRSNRQRSPDQTLPQKRRKDIDQSPARRGKSPKRKKGNRTPSPPYRKTLVHSPARDSNTPDNSPPRRRRRDSNQSPTRKTKSSFDKSPQRQNRKRMQMPDDSDVRKLRSITPDLSPPRRRHNFEQTSIRNKRTSLNYNNRKRDSDESPPRRPRNSDKSSRHSPRDNTTRDKRTQNLSPQARCSRWTKQESDKSLSPPPTHKPKPTKTLDGKKSGLQDARDLKKETKERRKHEDILFETMPADISGRHAEVQVRSTGRKGRRAKEAAEEDPEERRRKEEHEQKKKFRYERWGKGLKQIEDHKNRMLEQKYESSKPLARYSNDEDLERHLKEKERAEDPMLEYMRKKRKEKEKTSGKPQIPRYEGSYPENRFGIRPGYRWDGVDRSNGYEKKYFAVQNEKLARQDEAYKYSVEDM